MEPRAAEARPDDQIEAFIERWTSSSAAERANFQSFAAELCDVLGVDRPEPARGDPASDRYTFEYPVRFANPDGSTSTGFIDLYRRDAFVMEAKQGSDQQLEEQLALFGGSDIQTRKGTAVRGTKNWSIAMQRARGQAERYAKALPIEHGWPPFLIVVDVGHCFELYADFSRTGKSYSLMPKASASRSTACAMRSFASCSVSFGPTRSPSTRRSGRPKLPGSSRIVSPSWPAPWKRKAIRQSSWPTS
jgi:hypothetical protein